MIPKLINNTFKPQSLYRTGDDMSCEIPVKDATSEEISAIFESSKTVAVVGLSTNPKKGSQEVAGYLKENGYTIIPVHPKAPEILEEKAYTSLLEIPVKVDIVCVFRPPEEAEKIVEDAISIKAKAVWMQLGIVNNSAAEKARDAGLQVVMNKCMKVEHFRYSRQTAH